MTAQGIVSALLETDRVALAERLPPTLPFEDNDKELDFYARQPFTALSYAKQRGHHPKLWQVVKGSVYEPEYRRMFGVKEAIIESRSPQMKTLKANRTELDDKERKEVMRKGAVWHPGNKDKPVPAVWKSEIRGKTWFVTNTHRAYRACPTLKGAIRAFKFIETTA